MAAAKRGEVEPEGRKNNSNCQDPRERKKNGGIITRHLRYRGLAKSTVSAHHEPIDEQGSSVSGTLMTHPRAL